MSGTYKTKTKLPCQCGHNRWKTKGDAIDALITEYKCRNCGEIRQVTRKQWLEEPAETTNEK